MKKLFLLTAAFSVIMCFNAFAFTSSNPDVTIKSGDTGRTYTWTSPLGTEITMPVITKDAVLSINKGDSDYMETYFYDPSEAINKDNNLFMFGYKNSAFAAPTLALERATEYSPLTISNYNVGDPILKRSSYKKSSRFFGDGYRYRISGIKVVRKSYRNRKYFFRTFTRPLFC